MASRVTDFAGTYPACETGGITILCDYLHIQPGLTAIIGGGGKTTLLRVLANELSAQARVIVATSTKMMMPEWCPALIDPSLGEVQEALSSSPVVCVGSIQEETGKMAQSSLAFPELLSLADYVLVEADGAKMLPLKAHAEYEPVIPECASSVVCVAGVDGVGLPVSEICHRPDRYAELAGISAECQVTPEAVAAVLNAESLHDMLLINKVEDPAQWQLAERIALRCKTPVVAGSLKNGEFRCLR